MAPDREPRPTAEKRSKPTLPLVLPHRALRRLLTLDTEPDLAPAGEWADIRQGTGVERPVPEWLNVAQRLHRAFAFIDISDFMAYTEKNGPHAAIEVLTRFREDVRDVSARRGVRVAKWLGDGVMLVAVSTDSTIAAAAELMLRVADEEFDVHIGIAEGEVLLFEGDDYIGQAVNLAARLCEAAAAGEILFVGDDEHVPEWVEVGGTVTVRVFGIGDVKGVTQLQVHPEAWDLSSIEDLGETELSEDAGSEEEAEEAGGSGETDGSAA
ncbi:MAG: hypothetical protein JJLCMIEE_01376 [Acidimicrobiales bacterium]|nr:MAG: adenylate/guanylate cyclase domain-containing protein [Actinomycetota bacterium]MBV6508316.1 hypothetical protein [Acidimicrobiales bacterium]RIK07098.1 MAG: hypothetical protein DCC48_04715 [Acidobacteriota bacterium]